MIAWCMWFNRNVVRHGHSRQSAEEVVQLVRFLLNEFQIANHTISLGPLEIEAKAIGEGVTFAWDVGIRNVIFKGDSKIVFDALMWLYQISQLEYLKGLKVLGQSKFLM